MVDAMDRRHFAATEHLQSAREYGRTLAKDREEKAATLTDEQKQQLQEYLQLMREERPEVYANDSRRRQ